MQGQKPPLLFAEQVRKVYRTGVEEVVALDEGTVLAARFIVFVFDRSRALMVDRVVERTGVAGFWPIDTRQQSYNVLVGPGTLASMAVGVDDGASLGIEPPTSFLAFSNVGGVESGAARTDAAVIAIEAQLDGADVRVQPAKQDLLEVADETASSLTELYFTMGMFAVVAGILLLVNIFVMLADERRSEFGMLRALGLRRLPLVAAFATEGWIYSLVASALGAILGIWLGRLMSWRADRILSSGDEVLSLDMQFA